MIESAKISEIATYFELLDPKLRRLVVLGEPGSGKTVSAIHLVVQLLESRLGLPDAARSASAVPIRISAAGWDGTTDLSGWLVTRICWEYPQLRPTLAKKLLAQELILPVIDGLDEMDTADNHGRSARALLDQLNEPPWRSRSVVVICRTARFQQLCRRGADNGLHGATTISLQPLTAPDISKYLTDYKISMDSTSPAWSILTFHMVAHPEGLLAATLGAPWMLSLTVTAIRHDWMTAKRLTTCATIDGLEELLFSAQIPAALPNRKAKDGQPKYSREDVLTWMRLLAAYLGRRPETGGAIRLEDIWKMAGAKRCRVLHGLSVGIITLVVVGLANISAFGLTHGLVAGLAAGIVAGLTEAKPSATAKRIVWNVPNRTRWPRGLAVGVAAVLFAGLPIFLVVGHADGVMAGAVASAAFGVPVGLPLALMIGLIVTDKDRLRIAVDPSRSIRDDIYAAISLRGMVAIVLGVAVGMISGFPSGLAVGLTAGLVSGQFGGVAAGRFFIATLIFRFTGMFTAKPTVFLEWARRGGLLRANVTAYQFRHDTYQKWLQV
ncbi:NACHT domain-containing protein [Nocardia salmonicida]|uniref:NACHT domain-containing protein n=1 Tax=Nocardia salmonicida TaxID=53431 RepID=UPI0007A3B99B|nr:NACHT domain-containing protein [Nocardia salmonicida]